MDRGGAGGARNAQGLWDHLCISSSLKPRGCLLHISFLSVSNLSREAAPGSTLDPPFCGSVGHTVLRQLISQVGLWEKACARPATGE